MDTNHKGYAPIFESKKARDILVVILNNNYHTHNSAELFEKAAKKRGIKTITINPSHTTLIKKDNKFILSEKNKSQKTYEINPTNTIVMPRRQVLNDSESKDLLRELQNEGFFCFNTLDAFETCEDKFITYKKLKDAGIPTPRTTVLTKSSMKKLNEKIELIGGQFPVVCKILNGTQGIGVFIIESMMSLTSTLQTMFQLAPKSDIILQEKINSDYDLRVHVLYDGFERMSMGTEGFNIIGCMKRNQLDGDFRSNYSLGSTVEKGELTPEQEHIAKLAAKATNCRWCGVDLIVDNRTKQSYVIEVNSSPGTHGITGVGDDVVSTIFDMFKEFKYTKYESNQVGKYETCFIKDIEIDTTINFDTKKSFTEMECSSVNARDEDVSFVFNGITYTKELSGIRKGDPMIELNIKFNGTTYKNELVVLKQINNNLNKNILIGGTKFMSKMGNNISVVETPFILTDNTTDFEIPVEKVEEGLLTEGRNWVFGVNDEDIKLSGLRKCLESFIHGSRGRYVRGKWSISEGGYDLEWELYYNDQPFMGKTTNEDVKFYHTYMPEKLAYKIAGVIECIFEGCKVDMSKYEK